MLKRITLGLCLLCTPLLLAVNPRWVMDTNYGPYDAFPMQWKNPAVQFYVDIGPLNSTTNHATALQVIQAAAAPWNQVTSLITLTYAGDFAEDVDSSNVYLGDSGLIWPSDVSNAPGGESRIAIVLDANGTLTDMLLGSGASAPSNCNQNAVLETMDQIDAPGWFRHDTIILNGRCATSAPESLLQMQYQLMRAFGRALGLGWSQTNDNVFTGSPTPTYAQQQHWPILHPVDILCGPYSYQCLPSPFQLRDDDLGSLYLLYRVYGNVVVPGKTNSLVAKTHVSGYLTFPDGTGMAGVNLTAKATAYAAGFQKDWESVSSVSGFKIKDMAGNPVEGPVESSTLLLGSKNRAWAGWFDLLGIAEESYDVWENITVTAQPVNPLYVGKYSVGPYRTNTVTPGGAIAGGYYGMAFINSDVTLNMKATGDTLTCTAGDTSTEAAPSAPDAAGLWSGKFCGYGHSVWLKVPVTANDILTVETTSTDENGAASTTKALPLIGAWHSTDPTGTLPTIAATAAPWNSIAPATTQLILAPATSENYRIALTEQRGEGRADFGYTGRILSIRSAVPSVLPLTGGSVIVQGTGFQPGNRLTVNGTAISISTLTSTTLAVTIPAGAAPGPVLLSVQDLKTGARATANTALSYQAGAPSADAHSLTAMTTSLNMAAGVDVSWAPTVQLTTNNQPAVSQPVQWVFGMQTATTVSDAQGIAQWPLVFHLADNSSNKLTACAWTTLCTTITLQGIASSNWNLAAQQNTRQQITAASTLQSPTLIAQTTQGAPILGVPVTIYQSLESWQPACITAPCPTAALYQANVQTTSTLQDGLTTITPLQLATAARTAVTVTAGTSSLSFVLQKTP